MNFLFVADTVYTQCGNRTYGLRVFGHEFFDDFLKVATSVTICARTCHVETPPSGWPQTNSDRIQFIGVPNVHGWRWVLGLNRQMQQILEDAITKADAIVARVPSTMGAAAVGLARRHEKPVLAEVVGDPWTAISNYGSSPIFKAVAMLSYRQLRRVMKNVDLASYVSRRILPDRYPVRHHVEMEEYSSIRLPDSFIQSARHYAVPPTPLKILALASFIKYKRHMDLIRACRAIQEQDIPFTLHMIGDGPTKQSVHTAAHKCGLQDQVIFHGYIADKEELFRIIDGCHVTVLPSATEGLPRSLLEGMARGLGAIGSDAGGIPDLTRFTETFHVGDDRALAKILQHAATDPLHLTQMSEHAIQTSLKYTASTLSPKRVRMYRLLAEMARYKKPVPKSNSSSEPAASCCSNLPGDKDSNHD